MSSKTLQAMLLAAPLSANAHYIFSQLVVNDQVIGGDYSHIRQNTNTYMPSFTDDIINSEELRCNAGATNAATETYDVMAGDKIGFKLAYDEFIEHPGPGFIYMSMADGDVSSYDGSGDWFKVWESGLSGPASDENNWGTWQADRMEFTIPADIPDGEYLVRPEHIGIHEGHVGKAQFYMECAQLRISGGGSGSPGPMVKIPGLYTPEEVNFNMWTSPAADTYTMPGPAVWTGGGTGGLTGSTSSGSTSSNSSSTGDYSSEGDYSSGDDYAPVPSAPAYSAPAASTPAYSAPAGTAPAYSAPAYSAPAAPAYSEPAYSEPAAPVYSEPAYSAPAYSAPAAPAYSAPTYDAPVWGAGAFGGSPSTMATVASSYAAPTSYFSEAESDCDGA